MIKYYHEAGVVYIAVRTLVTDTERYELHLEKFVIPGLTQFLLFYTINRGLVQMFTNSHTILTQHLIIHNDKVIYLTYYLQPRITHFNYNYWKLLTINAINYWLPSQDKIPSNINKCMYLKRKLFIINYCSLVSIMLTQKHGNCVSTYKYLTGERRY